MARLKKVLEIVALPLVLVIGHAVTAMVLLLFTFAIAAYLGWLIGLNAEGPSGPAVVLDTATLVALMFVLKSRRFRNGAAEIWKQVSRNL